MEIAGVADFHPEVRDSPSGRTLTLWFDYGEGEPVYGWVRETAQSGSSVVGTRSITVHWPGGSRNYFGAFPIAWQLVDGVERAVRGRQRVVISYNRSE